MTSIVAYPEAITWLYGKLTNTPITGVLDVFEDDAPEGATSADDVWVVFEAMAPGADVSEVGAQRIWTEFAFRVWAVARGSDTIGLKDIATEIDARLDRASGVTSDGQIISSVRTDEDHGKWLEQGVEYRALGGLYNLIVQSLTP